MLFAAFVCWQEESGDRLFFSSLFFFTYSAHHLHFGVFLPQKGAAFCAILAELSLPQSWSNTEHSDPRSMADAEGPREDAEG